MSRGSIRVAIHEEHEIFGSGLRASVEADDALEVAAVGTPTDPHRDVDVAIVSPGVARDYHLPCPLVLCVNDDGPPRRVHAGNVVAGVLHRGTVTAQQLHAAVRAAAAGLRISADTFAHADPGGLEPRAVRVLELLADGRTTREIAGDLSYSERTIKKHIHDVERLLGARSRPHAVARAIRQGII